MFLRMSVKKTITIIITWVLTLSCIPLFNLTSMALVTPPNTTVVYPTEISDVLHNPDMGWVYVTNAIPGHEDLGRVGTFPEVDNVAICSTWAELESVEGQFSWTRIDNAIAYWGAQQGKRIHFRISTEPYIIGYYSYSAGSPSWLYSNYSIPYQNMTAYGFTYRVPDYTNTIYLTKLNNFLTAFANRYRNNAYLDIVDLRGYGLWGEWHSGHNFANVSQRESGLATIIDNWYSAWQENKILALSCSYEFRNDMTPNCSYPTNYNDYKQWSAFDYALTKPNLTIRRDGLAGAMLTWDSKYLTDFFNSGRNLPVMGEFFGGYSAYRDNLIANYTPDTAVDEALSYHPNYLTMMGWDADASAPAFYSERSDLISKGNKMMGYRFVLSEASYPTTILPGEGFVLKQSWVNRAVGKCFNKYPLKIYLTDSNGNEVWSATDDKFDQRSFVKDNVYDVDSGFVLPSTVSAGTYSLRVAMVDSNGQSKIKIAISNEDSQGRYILGNVNVANNPKTYGFETGEDTASCFWMPQGSAFNNSNSSKVITGNYSFYSESESAWEQMLSSIPATLPMKPNTTYRYSYDYLVDKSPGADTFFIIVRSDTVGSPLGVLFSQWVDIVGNKGNKTFEFTTGNANNYYILLGAQTGGAICYDNLKLEEKNGDNSYTTVSNVGFETGGLPAAYWNPSVNCSFIHSNTEAIIAGQYSYFANISSSGFVDCLQSDNSNLQLLPNTSYTISFKYNIERNAGSFFYFYTRNGLGQTIGFNQWDVSDSGNSGIKTYIFNTSNATDTWLTWGVKDSGAFSIDDISIYETLIPTTFDNYTISTDGGNIITGVLPGKTLADFMTGVTVGNHTNILTTDYNGTVITNNYVGTGTTIAVTQNNTTINYKIVIYGEVNGDGLIDVSDLVLIKNHILRINTLNEQFIKAGDVFLKGNISISDFLAVKKHILQIDVINQNP
jgi:hypothetical protein